jgi:hypothetical protein
MKKKTRDKKVSRHSPFEKELLLSRKILNIAHVSAPLGGKCFLLIFSTFAFCSKNGRNKLGTFLQQYRGTCVTP